MLSTRTLLPFVLAALSLSVSPDSVVTAQGGSAASDLAKAVKEKDVDGFLGALPEVLESNDRKAVKLAVDGYAKLAKTLMKKSDDWPDFVFLHRKTANAFGVATGKYAVKEMERIQKSKRGDWLGRLLLLDAAAFNEKLNLEESCVRALRDKSPQVVRRALRFLRKTKSIPAVEGIVSSFVDAEAKYGGKKDREWNRTLLTYQSTLIHILHVDLPAAPDWQNYVKARKDRPDFFEPRQSKGSGRTQVTLFGAAVTGKNIAFVLDISGSMLSTDPLPPGSKKNKTRPRTVVNDPDNPPPPPKPPEERRRITRAKKELIRVVQALPRDVSFNLITYSTDVYPWQKSGVPASSKNKADAEKFITDIRAEGITVTDMALEEAMGDLDVDTIYLITDGAPTHVGTRGRGLPPDAERIIRGIHKRMKDLNFLREVRVFSLGFKGAKEDFLQKLSKDHGGKYVAIE